MSEPVAVDLEAPSSAMACRADFPSSAANKPSAPQASLANDVSLVVQEPSTLEAPAAAKASAVVPFVPQVPLAAEALSAAPKSSAIEAGHAPLAVDALPATGVPPEAEAPCALKTSSAKESPLEAEASIAANTSAATEAPFQTPDVNEADVPSTVPASHAAKASLAAKVSSAADALPAAKKLLQAESSSVTQVRSVAEKLPAAHTKCENIKKVPEKMKVNTALAEKTATNFTGKRKASDKTAAPRKRCTLSPPVGQKPRDEEEEETESEPEKQPKKRAKTIKGAKKSPKTPGRKKKVITEPLDNEDEEQRAVEKKVEALSDEITDRFGQIVWAKMGGYPYWPCIITDPRLLPKKLQETAMKTLGTKYLVFFYVSNNFAPISFKKIVPWGDTKFEYREGYPEKDSKAPKRRAKLMTAIEIADKEINLPVGDRAAGLLKPEKRGTGVKTSANKSPTPVKRKPGRPPKVKPVVKPTPKKTPKNQAIKEEVANEDKDMDAGSVVTQVETEDNATLSKEEIKAKVASRKLPKKKEAEDSANAPTASAKKTLKGTAKQSHPNNSIEIDSKRKKEIELVVPHKSVKSADIREMTDEAAKKKRDNGPKRKAKKDKGNYIVGDLAAFANKMARLHANESSRNNDELVGMMQELFKEELMYRSDVERSGLAAIIALLRKSWSPTVGHTASALRKHMINILNNDTEIIRLGKKGSQGPAAYAPKKRKTENGSLVVLEETQPRDVSLSETNENCDAKGIALSPPAIASLVENSEPLVAKTKSEDLSSALVEIVAAEVPAVKEPAKAAPDKDEAVKTVESAEKMKETLEKQPTSPVKTEVRAEGAVNDQVDLFETPQHMEKNRTIFVDMLSKILDQNGSKCADLAMEIEAALFERFKESNGDYLTQARIILFGLKENSSMRKRLFSGALHCLEFAYADDAFFKAE